MVFNVIILVALVRLLLVTRQPLLCSGIYAAAGFVMGFFFQQPMQSLLLSTAIGFGLATLYFWLLNRLSGTLWWVVCMGGFLIALV